MNQDFEIWLCANERALNEDALGLFHDSLKCFKNDIIRPSYLLAYQGLLMQVRTNVLNSKRPDDFPEHKWNKMISLMSTADKWDEATFDAVQKRETDKGETKEPPVVKVAESVRTAFVYWRDLRNVCAHYKDDVFTKAHTLTLYAFIQQNILSITVEGGFELLLQEFKDYYTPAKTNPSLTPIEPLLDKICVVVLPNERVRFVEEVISFLQSRFHFGEDDQFLKTLWNHSAELKSIIKTYFNSHKENRVYFVDTLPSAVLDLFAKDEIHELWYREIPKMENGCEVLSELLIAGLIDDREKEDVAKRILEYKYTYNLEAGELNPVQIVTLQTIRYFDYFMEKYMDASFTGTYRGAKETHGKSRFYMSHLRYVDFGKKENAKSIYDVFSKTYHPYSIAGEFRGYLRETPVRCTLLIDTLKSMELELPEAISFKKKEEVETE